jgi:hypothetical protein
LIPDVYQFSNNIAPIIIMQRKAGIFTKKFIQEKILTQKLPLIHRDLPITEMYISILQKKADIIIKE